MLLFFKFIFSVLQKHKTTKHESYANFSNNNNNLTKGKWRMVAFGEFGVRIRCIPCGF